MINFTKMEGLGNDYVYLDCTNGNIPDNISDLTKKISDRHFGIGSDGVILILPSETCDFKMRMFNKDGSEAQMCGNGIRCVGKFVYDKGLTKNTTITIDTLAGIKKLYLETKNEKVETVTVDMGEPILNADDIPVIIKNENCIYNQKNEKRTVQNLIINALEKNFEVTCVSMGNPHAVIIVNNVENFDVEKYGKILEIDEHFPKKANIEFAEILDKNTIKMRVWERGSGETFACGTGACATLVACSLNGLVENEATLKLLGGDLKIKWDKETNHVYMTGPAKIVFEGQIQM